MTISVPVLAFKGLDVLIKENKGSLTLSDFFTNAIFRNIVLSLAAMLGLYVFASLLFVSSFLVLFFFLLSLTMLAVRAMAFDHFFWAVHANGAIIHPNSSRTSTTSHGAPKAITSSTSAQSPPSPAVNQGKSSPPSWTKKT
jgi:hypothetical protein